MAEHNTLTGTSLHEPKGVASASLGQVYVADGAGSGTWETPSPATHGEMIVENYSTGFLVGAAVDPTLNTDTDYTKVSAIGMWAAGHNDNINFNVDQLEITIDGEYELNFWASLDVSVTNTLIGIKFVINNTLFSTRKILSKSKVISDVLNVSAAGFVTGLVAGDSVSIWIAADTACTVTGQEAGTTIKLLEAT